MKLRPAIKYHGGQFHFAPWIIKHLPGGHTRYVEPYGGMASVLLQKEPVPFEVWNDLSGDLYALMSCMRISARFRALKRRLQCTPYSEFEYKIARERLRARSFGTMVEHAALVYVVHRMSLGGRTQSFSVSTSRLRRGMADVVSGWLSSIDENMEGVRKRFERVQVLSRDGLAIIRKFDSADTLFYCDPPYHPHVVGVSQYPIPMDAKQHNSLMGLASGLSGAVAISGYRCPAYDTALKHPLWKRHDMQAVNNAAGGKIKKTVTASLWVKQAKRK